jgi:undecaprenyl-diphosphatase
MGGYVFATVAATGIAVNAVKFLVGRGRPRVLFRDGWVGFQPLDGSSDFLSFPSGHATTAGAVAAALWVLWPRHGRLLLLCALLVGVARAALNAHFLSDIVAGLYLGGVGAIVVAWLFLRFGYDPRRASAFESSR